LLASPSEDRVALNVGGIANVTSLPAGCDPYDVMAFDCGPGVMLLDAFVQTRSEGELTMDVDGAFAAAGMHDGNLLRAMLGDDYFAQPPPKSTGRERFGATFLAHHAATLGGLSLEDGCATLVEVTATAIAAAIVDLRMAHARVLVSGGGARNLALLDRLRAMLPDAALEPTDAYGLPVDAKEAMAFAVLGYETLRERAANVPRVTGASRAVPLGAIAPSDLRGLLAEVERECR
jgi:anhydro-N-acetylmuramic acid kinase